MKTKPIYTILFSGLFFFMSCMKCEHIMIEKIEFTPTELKVNPYEGNEVLKFVDNNKDTIVYEGNYRKISIHRNYGCSDCCDEYYEIDWVDNTYFKSAYLDSDLQVILSLNYDTNNKKRSTDIHFAWTYYDIYPNFTSTSFQGLLMDSMRTYALKRSMFRDTVVLRDKIFTQVYVHPGAQMYDNRLLGDTLYYSTTEGIVGLAFSDGNLWVVE